MSTAVWSYIPTEGVTEDMQAAIRGDAWGPRAAVYATVTSRQIHRFELSWGPAVDSTEVRSMLAFFRARYGSYDPFIWQSPIDSRTYQVRFDSSIKADLFQPTCFRSGAQLVFTTIHTPTLSTVIGSDYVFPVSSVDNPPPPAPGSGGVPSSGDVNSGTGIGPAGFWFPDAWYWVTAAPEYAAPSAPNALTTNVLFAQPFAVTQSGVALDALGVSVTSYNASPVQWAKIGVYASIGASGTVYNTYPSSLIGATSLSLTASGMVTNALNPTLTLETGAYWVVLVTSFAGPAGTGGTDAMFRNVGPLGALIMGVDSSHLLAGGHTFIFTHSYDLPSQFPSSATASTPDPVLYFHVASQSVS